MNGAKVLFNRLKHHNVKYVFGYPGGAILPVLNEFYNQNHIKYILSRTEAGGSFMAEGYSKALKQPGVVMVTSGPGAINVMTSLQNALSDGTAILALTGQVSTVVLGTDAFQEADVIGISKPCTKWNNMLTDSSKIDATVDKAFEYMVDKRHGPVLIDLPKNIMSALSLPQDHRYAVVPRIQSAHASTISIGEIRALLTNAKKPVILAGQGIFQSGAHMLLREFANVYNIPVTTTLLGLGIVDETDNRSLKMLGMHGSYTANMAIQNCDLLLNFGSRFDDRIIGDPSQFAKRATIVHVDILLKNISKTIPVKFYRNECCAETLTQLLKPLPDNYMLGYFDWHTQILSWKKTGFTYNKGARVLQGRHVLATLNRIIQADLMNAYTIVSDVGAHQMWCAQFIDYNAPRVKFITSGGLGTMGFALPASIGVKIGLPQDRVICVCGDGGFLMTFQELVTAIENNIGIKVIILNNSCQLMVQIWQEKFYNNQTVGTKMNNPPFEQVCRALGCEALRVDSDTDLERTLHYFLEYSGPIVLNLITDSAESVLPMVSPGKALDDMILEEVGELKGDAPC